MCVCQKQRRMRDVVLSSTQSLYLWKKELPTLVSSFAIWRSRSNQRGKQGPSTSVTKGLISSLEKARQVAKELATITELFSRASPQII